MVVVPGALDMLDFFIDEDGRGLPDDIDRRKKVYHNSSIVHTKIYREEAVKLARVLAGRLNKSTALYPIWMKASAKAAEGGQCSEPGGG